MKMVCIHDYGYCEFPAPKYLEVVEAEPITRNGVIRRYRLEKYKGIWYSERFTPLEDPPENTIVTRGE